MKKGALRDSKERGMSIDIMSKRRKKLYHAQTCPPEMKSSFPHPVFKSSGDVEVMRNVDPMAIQRMRPAVKEEEPEPELPKLGWKEFRVDQEAIDRMAEEAVPEIDRPVCLDFLRGHCPNPKCLNRHEDDGSVIAPPVRTTLPKDPKKAAAPQKRAMNRVAVKTKRVVHSNAQQVVRPHGIPIPKHPADILHEKGPGAQESSDSGEGSLPPDATEFEDLDSPLSPPKSFKKELPDDRGAFPERRQAHLPIDKMHSRVVSGTDLGEPEESKPEEPQLDEPEEPQPDEPGDPDGPGDLGEP
jgi:hypothetical protein